MATYNFDLLDLADGEYGDAAVSVLVGKKKTETEAAAKLAADLAQEKAATGLKYSYYARLQHDNGVTKCEHEMKRLKNILIKLREKEAKLKQQGANEALVSKLVEEQRKLRQEQRKIRLEEAIILPLRDAFYKEHGIPLPVKNKKSQGERADSGRSCDDGNGNGNVCNNNDGSNNCDDAETEADEKPGEKVVSASETKHKEVSVDNANVVPASVAENSAGGAAQNGSSNGQGKGTFRKEKLNGSKKKKKKASKKNNGNEPERAKKQNSEAIKEPLTSYVKEEEKNVHIAEHPCTLISFLFRMTAKILPLLRMTWPSRT